MSFEFKWPSFEPAFYDHAKRLLAAALNKGDKPAILTDPINVIHLHMGSIPPHLEILEIGDLARDRFRGIFRLSYAGDASICLQTNVQANPLSNSSTSSIPDILSNPPILFASSPLVVPMTLTLSNLKLRAIVVLVISPLDGVTLVFKNDPLESVSVSSTFDSLAAIQTFLQAEIERQLRDLFRTELPSIIHQLSRRWLRQDALPSSIQPRQTHPPPPPPPPTPVPSLPSTPVPTPASVPDAVEAYDPTYGLRPSHPPLVGTFRRYRSLVAQKTKPRGLGAALVASSSSSSDDDDDKDSHPPASHRSSATSCATPASPTPAARRPRPKVLHSHSARLASSDASPPPSSRGGPAEWNPALRSRFPTPIHTPRVASPAGSPRPPPCDSPIFLASHSSTSTDQTPSFYASSSARGMTQTSQDSSLTSCTGTGTGTGTDEDWGRTEECSLLASLVRGNWTLSPFSRSIEHFVARSTPLLDHQTQYRSGYGYFGNHMNFHSSKENGNGGGGGSGVEGIGDGGGGGMFRQKRVTRIGPGATGRCRVDDEKELLKV